MGFWKYLIVLLMLSGSHVVLADEALIDDDGIFLDMDLDLEDPGYPGGGNGGNGGNRGFRCEIVIILVNVNNRFERQRHSVFGNGRSWGDSRGNAFGQYGQWIGRNQFWGNQFRHSFYFNNCFS